MQGEVGEDAAPADDMAVLDEITAQIDAVGDVVMSDEAEEKEEPQAAVPEITVAEAAQALAEEAAEEPAEDAIPEAGERAEAAEEEIAPAEEVGSIMQAMANACTLLVAGWIAPIRQENQKLFLCPAGRCRACGRTQACAPRCTCHAPQ